MLVYLYAASETFGIKHTLALRLTATVFGIGIAIIGYTYPVLRYLQRLHGRDRQTGAASTSRVIRRMLLAACLSGVALLGTWGGTQQSPAWADSMTDKAEHAKEHMLIWLSVGAIVGTIAAALLGDAVGRRKAYFLLCILSFGSVILLFQYDFVGRSFDWTLLLYAFIAGTCTASFYGWLPLYLPELFTTNVRATGQGFGFNFGRVLAAVGSFQLGTLVRNFNEPIQLGPIELAKGYPIACTILSTVYGIGMILIWFAPETRGKPLPE
jgi:MFS transporter, SHS family, sialic acid transporter